LTALTRDGKPPIGVVTFKDIKEFMENGVEDAFDSMLTEKTSNSVPADLTTIFKYTETTKDVNYFKTQTQRELAEKYFFDFGVLTAKIYLGTATEGEIQDLAQLANTLYSKVPTPVAESFLTKKNSVSV
jgi:hypothetical protein